MDFFDSSMYYRLNKRLLFYLGLWPLQTRNERNFYRTTTLVLIGSLVVPKLIKFVNCLGDLYGMIQCLPMLAVHFRSFVKFINTSVKITELRKLTNRIKHDWTVSDNVTTLRSYAERGRLLTVIYASEMYPLARIVYIFSALAIYLSIPLILVILDIVVPLNEPRNRIYLFQTEYFVDPDEKYYYILMHAYVSMPVSLGILVAYDTMYAVYVQHACGIFATLGARLRSIGENANIDGPEIYGDPVKCSPEAYNDIVICIKMHNEAVENATLIESTTNISCLFVLGASMLTITVTGFVGVTSLDHPSEVLQYVLIVGGELFHLFYICWQGQLLMQHSEDIFDNAYNVYWYDIPPRAKKLLILIMLRSLKPCKLTSGKVFILSMENFAATLKTSMSYFTVLLSMQ